MGLITKIEDKLSGNKSSESKYTEQNTSSTGTASHLQHPVSSSTSGPTGTAVPNTTSSSSGGDTSGVGRDGYGTTDPYVKGPSGYGTSDRYTNEQSGYGNSDRYPTQQSGHSTSNRYPDEAQPTTHSTTTRSEMPGGYGSSDPRTTTTTTNTSSSGPRQPYDPYSSKGQRTAADAAQSHGMSPTTSSSRAPYEDANVARSHQRGVLNSTTGQQQGYSSGQQGYSSGQQGYSSGQQGYSSGQQGYSDASGINSAPHASSGRNVPESGRQDMSSGSGDHHYGRDAAVAGGVGAGGIGAYEMGKHRDGNTSSSQNYSRPQEREMGYGSEQPVRRSAEDPNMGGVAGPMSAGGMSTGSSHTGGSSSGGLEQAKKMGSAYEAGYRDGMEHMRQEMENAKLGR